MVVPTSITDLILRDLYLSLTLRVWSLYHTVTPTDEPHTGFRLTPDWVSKVTSRICVVLLYTYTRSSVGLNTLVVDIVSFDGGFISSCHPSRPHIRLSYDLSLFDDDVCCMFSVLSIIFMCLTPPCLVSVNSNSNVNRYH